MGMGMRKLLFGEGAPSPFFQQGIYCSLRSLGVFCYNRWLLNEGHKNYVKDQCLMNSQFTFLILTSF